MISIKKIFCLGSLFIFLVTADTSFAESAKKTAEDISAQKVKIIKNFRKIKRFVLCIEGYKVFQTIGPSWGKGASPAISSVQMFEEKNGKSLPAKCTNDTRIRVNFEQQN